MVKVSRRFSEAFALVHEAFGSSAADIAEAKFLARANMVAAEDGYYTSAAMIQAGWKPRTESAAAFLAGTGFRVPSRWPTVQPEHIEIEWPRKALRKAA